MNLRHGIDIVEIPRFRAWLEEPKAKLEDRFTRRELEDARCVNRIPRLAGRFAAKEAVLKALGTGWVTGFRWTSIEILNSASGAPNLVLHEEVSEYAKRLGLSDWTVSISHSSIMAVASVVAYGGSS